MTRKIAAIVPDLFFQSRVREAARHLALDLSIVEPGRALESLRAGPPDLIVLDLETPGDPLGLARRIRADHALAHVRVMGFCSHVNVALREQALAAGVDQVLPRSAFVRGLPGLLAGEPALAGPPPPPARGPDEAGRESVERLPREDEG